MEHNYFDEAGYNKALENAEGFAASLNELIGTAKEGGIKITDSTLRSAIQLESFSLIEDEYKEEISEGLPSGLTITLDGAYWPQLRSQFSEIIKHANRLKLVTIAKGKASVTARIKQTLRDEYTHKADERELRLYKALEGLIEALKPLEEFGRVSKHPMIDNWMNSLMRDYDKTGTSVRMVNQKHCKKHWYYSVF